MTKRLLYFFLPLFTLTLLLAAPGKAQVVSDTVPRNAADTVALRTNLSTDTLSTKEDSVVRIHSPKKAAIRSAIIPGWGQAYNKRYWKIPIVYGALGTAAGIFAYNLKYYRELRFAVQAHYKAGSPTFDSSDYNNLEFKYQIYDQETLKYYRDEFRRNIDYSILAFVLLWGLNVADAAVDAHLRSFNVSPDLSLKVKPVLGNTPGISIVLAFK